MVAATRPAFGVTLAEVSSEQELPLDLQVNLQTISCSEFLYTSADYPFYAPSVVYTHFPPERKWRRTRSCPWTFRSLSSQSRGNPDTKPETLAPKPRH